MQLLFKLGAAVAWRSVLQSHNPEAADSSPGWVRKDVWGKTIATYFVPRLLAVANPEEEKHTMKDVILLTFMLSSILYYFIR